MITEDQWKRIAAAAASAGITRHKIDEALSDMKPREEPDNTFTIEALTESVRLDLRETHFPPNTGKHEHWYEPCLKRKK